MSIAHLLYLSLHGIFNFMLHSGNVAAQTGIGSAQSKAEPIQKPRFWRIAYLRRQKISGILEEKGTGRDDTEARQVFEGEERADGEGKQNGKDGAVSGVVKRVQRRD